MAAHRINSARHMEHVLPYSSGKESFENLGRRLGKLSVHHIQVDQSLDAHHRPGASCYSPQCLTEWKQCDQPERPSVLVFVLLLT